jgi:hypothetical protein
MPVDEWDYKEKVLISGCGLATTTLTKNVVTFTTALATYMYAICNRLFLDVGYAIKPAEDNHYKPLSPNDQNLGGWLTIMTPYHTFPLHCNPPPPPIAICPPHHILTP